MCVFVHAYTGIPRFPHLWLLSPPAYWRIAVLSHFIAQGIDAACVVWIGQVAGLQHVGYLQTDAIQSGVDIDEFVAGLFTDLAVYTGSLSLRLILPSGDLIEVSAETSVEFGPEVLDVTFTGLVPDWVTGRWVP